MTSDAYSFELAWRWTQPSHAVLPPDVMAQIVPLANPVRRYHAQVRPCLDENVFEDIERMSGGVPTSNGTQQLQRLPVSLNEQVTVEWDRDLAIRTTWEIFTRYWDDFCYPATDDIEVYPADESWMLIYRHWGTMEWGRRRASPRPPQNVVRVTITRFVDADPHPGVVEFELVDVHGKVWRFLAKTTIVSTDYLHERTPYPQPGTIAAEIVSRRVDASGREIVTVDTSRPWGVETVDEVSRFEVFAEQVTELSW